MLHTNSRDDVIYALKQCAKRGYSLEPRCGAGWCCLLRRCVCLFAAFGFCLVFCWCCLEENVCSSGGSELLSGPCKPFPAQDWLRSTHFFYLFFF